MQVRIKLFAFFRKGRFISEVREVADGISAGEIIDVLGINRDEVGVLTLNSKPCQLNTVLQEGDEYSIFPVIGGG